MINILFLHTNIPNYVTDGLFHGLANSPDVLLIDCPRNDVMYLDAPAEALAKTGSRGNTLYGRLKENPAVQSNRTFWQRELSTYDLIVIADIGNNAGLFDYVYHRLSKTARDKICIIDGYDSTALFPFFNIKQHLRNHRWYFQLPISKVKIFKREFESVNSLYGWPTAAVGSRFLKSVLKAPRQLLPISMSIPADQIEEIPFETKQKDFVNYHIDPELDELFPDTRISGVGKWQPAVCNPVTYEDDIRKSRFGITVKRRGWDSLRHYEYAAKGAILCFKDLEQKPPSSAPFLLGEHNCIIYHGKKDLLEHIKQKSIPELTAIQTLAYQWVKQHSTIEVAKRFLKQALEGN